MNEKHKDSSFTSTFTAVHICHSCLLEDVLLKTSIAKEKARNRGGPEQIQQSMATAVGAISIILCVYINVNTYLYLKNPIRVAQGIATRSVPNTTKPSPITAWSVTPSARTSAANIAVKTIESLSITVTVTVGPSARA